MESNPGCGLGTSCGCPLLLPRQPARWTESLTIYMALPRPFHHLVPIHHLMVTGERESNVAPVITPVDGTLTSGIVIAEVVTVTSWPPEHPSALRPPIALTLILRSHWLWTVL
uniref:Uncharacterized protein n=1 Tax=Rangifer tarandus platyrhynchus TaxID=3082113 RepID=A0ACB0DZQ3_RANTA|nr:unnamed protein product [Rangifer tarandus platyrhynchus]